MWRELRGLFEDWSALPEVLILTVLIFGLLTFLRGTRGEGMLKTLAAFLAIGFVVLRTLALEGEFKRLTLVLDAIFQASVITLVVIFQPELRRGLALKIGSSFMTSNVPQQEIVDEVVNAATRLAKTKIGALIVLERKDSLKEYVSTGTTLDAEVRTDLLRTVFYVGTPLHDGAVIIQGGRVAAAGCFLPLTDNPAVPKALGTRHRAAIGLSEVEDALVIVCSEETGAISLAEGGNLHRELDREQLLKLLHEMYLKQEEDEEGGDGGAPAPVDPSGKPSAKTATGSHAPPKSGPGKTTSRTRRRAVPS